MTDAFVELRPFSGPPPASRSGRQGLPTASLRVEERLVEPEIDGARLMTFLNQG